MMNASSQFGATVGKKKDRRIARKSLGEEKKAVRDYGARAASAKSPRLKSVLQHNRAEEKEHAAALRPFAKRKRR